MTPNKAATNTTHTFALVTAPALVEPVVLGALVVDEPDPLAAAPLAAAPDAVAPPGRPKGWIPDAVRGPGAPVADTPTRLPSEPGSVNYCIRKGKNRST